MVSQRNASSYAAITRSRSSHRWWFVKKGNLKNTYSEKYKRTAASMGRLFREVFQMQSSCYSSHLKAVINHVRKDKSLVSISSLDGQKNKLLSEWKCPEPVVQRCYVKLFLNISENFQENTCSEVSFYQSYRSQEFWSEFCKIFNDTHKKNCFIQFSTRMGGWLLLTFLMCLHNQLSSIMHCITRIKSTYVWKCDSSNRQ